MGRFDSAPPLLADAMLGKLARWLRLAGYDTAYLADTDDLEVIRLARAEDRVILTRDIGLATRHGVDALLIDSQQVEQQMQQVRDYFGPPGEEAFSRCSICNQQLESLSPEAARERVPPYVARTQTDFKACPVCHRVYWPGTHVDGIQSGLDKI